MKTISRFQAVELDRRAIQEFGISSLFLMENAGRSVAELTTRVLGGKHQIVVVCGKGNNGGDGFVAARYLVNQGYHVQVFLFADPNRLKDDPAGNYEILLKMNIPVSAIDHEKGIDAFRTALKNPDVVIDALFGVGLNAPVQGIFLDVITAINESGKQVVSVDIPSGLDADTGEILGAAVKANFTATLGAAKHGLFLQEGPKCAGNIEIIDIGLPKEILP